jgi:formylmethanofuran dehydrogenase subunit C
MALAIDAKATASTHTAGALTLTNTTLTVGSGATCLLAALVFQEETRIPSAISVHWDSTGTNQLMTLIPSGSGATSNDNGQIRLYGLVNPTAGNKTLSATWTGSVPAVLDAMSFSGGDTTSVSAAFANAHAQADPNTLGTPSTPTNALTGASGNISVCVVDHINATVTGLTTTSSTSWFTDTTEPNLKVQGATAPSASSVTWTSTPNDDEWVLVGVDVVAGAPSGITGDLALTTGAATLSAAGTVLVSGTLSKTTAAATLSAAGTVLVSGGLTTTTGAATLSSAGTVLVSGTLSKTAGAATLAAAAFVGNNATLSATTGAATLSAAGTVLVSGTLSKTTGAATLSATGLTAALGTLSRTTGAAALSAAGTVLVSGTLSRTTDPATIAAAGGVIVSATLARTADAATLSATGTVVSGAPITGTLAITLQNAVMFQPTLPANQLRIIHPPLPYIPSPLPLMDGGLGPYAKREYDKIQQTLSTVLILLPQEANVVPTKLISGMVRFARDPWRPAAGQTDDAWVYYDGPTQTWKLVTP